jgi:predicted Rossmann fold nucleotide-binding protein DprA/Smf involved in DNA uptake
LTSELATRFDASIHHIWRKKMQIARKLTVLITSTSLCIGAVAPAFAQNDAAASAAASAAKPTKAQRKEARKEARAKRNAELKKLEEAGYQPSRAGDPNYPEDLQNAEKKAGIGQGASQ